MQRARTYGEGASVIQERTHAYALKSTLWLMDPRPNLPTIVHCVEKAFELSEASNTPVILELRIRACHVQGHFIAKDNIAPAISTRHLTRPAPHDYEKLAHPPVTYGQEKKKYDQRMPAARKFIVENDLNEVFEGRHGDVGLIVQGGLYNSLVRAMQEIGLADAMGKPDIPMLVLNVVNPLVPEQITGFAAGKRAVLVIEEGQPEYLEHEIGSLFRRADLQTRLHGKNMLPMAGEYTSEVMLSGLAKFLKVEVPQLSNLGDGGYAEEVAAIRKRAAELLGGHAPPRPPTFCTGCPERPFFSALKLMTKDTGPVHVSADIGCHAFGTFAPFNFGNSILGYGMSLASSAGVQSFSGRRPIAIMGDGGFWHNGLLSGVTSRLLNKSDGVLVVMKNGYTSATGTQDLVSSPAAGAKLAAAEKSATGAERTIEKTLEGLGVGWLRTVHTYRVAEMKQALQAAMDSPDKGLKVIVAEGECQLERQRRIRPIRAAALERGERVVRTRYGVDDDTCTGDHSCIRLSGCPTLTVKTSTDPLKAPSMLAPVATT